MTNTLDAYEGDRRLFARTWSSFHPPRRRHGRPPGPDWSFAEDPPAATSKEEIDVVNTMPPYEILSDEAMDTLDRGWKRIVTEIGIEFDDRDALEIFRHAGQQVEGSVVKLDPDFVLEQVALAPESSSCGLVRRARRRRRGPAHGLPPRLRMPLHAGGKRPPRGDDATTTNGWSS